MKAKTPQSPPIPFAAVAPPPPVAIPVALVAPPARPSKPAPPSEPGRPSVWAVLGLVFLALVVLNALMGDAPWDRAGQTPSPTATRPTIPYRVIKSSQFHHYKASFDVRVDRVGGRLPNKDELAAISRALKDAQSQQTRLTFVCFYLPGMEVDAGAFATAHHEPDLSVNVYLED